MMNFRNYLKVYSGSPDVDSTTNIAKDGSTANGATPTHATTTAGGRNNASNGLSSSNLANSTMNINSSSGYNNMKPHGITTTMSSLKGISLFSRNSSNATSQTSRHHTLHSNNSFSQNASRQSSWKSLLYQGYDHQRGASRYLYQQQQQNQKQQQINGGHISGEYQGFAVLTIGLSIRFIIAWLGCSEYSIDYSSAQRFSYISALVSIFLQIIPAYLYMILFTTVKNTDFISSGTLPPSTLNIGWHLQHFVLFGFVGSIGMELIMRTYYGACSNSQLVGSLNCNPYYESGLIPLDSAMLLLFTPSIFRYVMPGFSRRMLFVAELLAVGWVVASLIMAETKRPIMFVLCCLFCSLIILVVPSSNARIDDDMSVPASSLIRVPEEDKLEFKHQQLASRSIENDLSHSFDAKIVAKSSPRIVPAQFRGSVVTDSRAGDHDYIHGGIMSLSSHTRDELSMIVQVCSSDSSPDAVAVSMPVVSSGFLTPKSHSQPSNASHSHSHSQSQAHSHSTSNNPPSVHKDSFVSASSGDSGIPLIRKVLTQHLPQHVNLQPHHRPVPTSHVEKINAESIRALERTPPISPNPKLSSLRYNDQDYENEKQELRNMLANTAHDLKTPLTAFTNGLDLAKSVVADLDFRIGAAMNDDDSSVGGKTKQLLAVVREEIGHLDSTLRNIGSTTGFMLMNINRIIDFSKASRGISLVPRPETFSFEDAMTLPLNCVRDLHPDADFQVNVENVNSSICPFIISDRQWFQENLLCLVSNAAKYSPPNCVVKISVRLKSTNDSAPFTRLVSEISHSSDYVLERLNSEDDGSAFIDDVLKKRTSSAFDRQSSCVESAVGSDRGFGRQSSLAISEDGVSVSHSKKRVQSSSIVDRKALRSVSGSSSPPQIDERFLVVLVEDEGVGLSPAAMAGMFEPFQQAQRVTGGTGLGLYSLMKRTQALGGSVGVMNRPDRQSGCVFWFAIPYIPDPVIACHSGVLTLPLYRLPSNLSTVQEQIQASAHSLLSMTNSAMNSMQTIPAYAVDSPATEQTRQLSGLSNQNTSSTQRTADSDTAPAARVLIVDDSPSILKLSAMMLRRKGFFVDVAEHGAQGLAMVQNADMPYTVVLMDIQMPVMDGLEATRRIREFERRQINLQRAKRRAILSSAAEEGLMSTEEPGDQGESSVNIEIGVQDSQSNQERLFIIGLSACSDNETITEAFLAGIDIFISKPFTIENFLNAMNNRAAFQEDAVLAGV